MFSTTHVLPLVNVLCTDSGPEDRSWGGGHLCAKQVATTLGPLLGASKPDSWSTAGLVTEAFLIIESKLWEM